MISYKRDVLERQSLSKVKMGRGSPICERVRKKIVEYFKNNGPQRQIAKALQISSSTVHNIIKIIKLIKQNKKISLLFLLWCRVKRYWTNIIFVTIWLIGKMCLWRLNA